MRAPSVSEAQATVVAEAAAVLLTQGPEEEISRETWSAELRALNPKSVRVDEEGVYVVTDSCFVEEAGLFVPRHPETFVAVGAIRRSAVARGSAAALGFTMKAASGRRRVGVSWSDARSLTLKHR